MDPMDRINTKNRIKGIIERSGKITDERPLVAFLYTLLRDEEISLGRVEELVQEIQNAHENNKRNEKPFKFSNGWVAQYAQDIANRLKE